MDKFRNRGKCSWIVGTLVRRSKPFNSHFLSWPRFHEKERAFTFSKIYPPLNWGGVDSNKHPACSLGLPLIWALCENFPAAPPPHHQDQIRVPLSEGHNGGYDYIIDRSIDCMERMCVSIFISADVRSSEWMNASISPFSLCFKYFLYHWSEVFLS